MRLTKTVALTEKGVVKTDVRKRMIAFVEKDPAHAMGLAQKVEGKNIYTIPVTDMEGNTFYITFDVTVSAKNPADRAEKKATKKAEKSEDTIEVE